MSEDTTRRRRRVTPPDGPAEVSRTYLVPCIHGDAYGLVRWWPVFGDEHTDPEIGANFRHWHFDFRFLTDIQLAHLLRSLGRHRRAEYVYGRVMNRDVMEGIGENRRLVDRITELRGPALRPRLCLREWPLYPRDKVGGKISSTGALDRFRVPFPRCMRCPHRGLDLRQVSPDERGIITCPGHGLQWRAATGEPIHA